MQADESTVELNLRQVCKRYLLVYAGLGGVRAAPEFVNQPSLASAKRERTWCTEGLAISRDNARLGAMRRLSNRRTTQ